MAKQYKIKKIDKYSDLSADDMEIRSGTYAWLMGASIALLLLFTHVIIRVFSEDSIGYGEKIFAIGGEALSTLGTIFGGTKMIKWAIKSVKEEAYESHTSILNEEAFDEAWEAAEEYKRFQLYR